MDLVQLVQMYIVLPLLQVTIVVQVHAEMRNKIIVLVYHQKGVRQQHRNRLLHYVLSSLRYHKIEMEMGKEMVRGCKHCKLMKKINKHLHLQAFLVLNAILVIR